MARPSTWVAPWRCDCDKDRYESERHALDAIRNGQERGHYDDTARAYKCPGFRCWHIATRGFSYRSLKTMHRMIAWHLNNCGTIDLEWLRQREMGIDPMSNRSRDFGRAVADLVRAGLAEDAPGRRLRAVDRAGLLRVMAVGWRQFQQERAAQSRPGAAGAGS